MAIRANLMDSVGFVLYELWMLRECAHMAKPTNRVLRNLWYEGLVLHSRVLRDFFFTKVTQKGANAVVRRTHQEDIVAVDYFSVASLWPYNSSNLPAYLHANKERMDRTVAHLSFDRLKYSGNDKDWSAAILLSEIGAVWFEFLERLELDSKSTADWFRNHDRARLVRFSPPL